MRNTKNFVLLLMAAGIFTIALLGFTATAKNHNQSLKVERQQWTLQHMTGYIPSEEFDIGITVDVPVSGNPVLVDSVMQVLNKAIYNFFENGIDPRFAPGELYCSDPKRLLQYYREAYKPFIEDTCEFDGCCPDFHYLSVTMVEQTELFVTYEVSNYFIGEGDCEYLDWVTFYKSDGHRLAKVIRDDGLLDLLKLSSGKNYDVWEDVEYRLSIGSELPYSTDFGLTSDSIWCQYFFAPGIVETFPFNMETARPYLTEEARRLLE